MEGHESSRGRSKREGEGSADARSSRVEDDEDWESDKRKHKLSKSRKQVDTEETDDQDSGRRKSSGDRNEARKKSSGLSRTDSGEEDDYDTRRELRSKIPRKSVDEGSEKRSNEGHWDKDLEASRKRDGESEWDSSKKSSSRPSGGESSQGKPRGKVESSYDAGIEKYQDRDLRHSERKDSNKYKKDQGQYEHEKNPQSGKWDETDDGKKDEDGSYAERSDPRSGKGSNHNKHGPSRNREPDLRNEPSESKSRVVDTSVEKASRSGNRDDWREENERSRNRGRLEPENEDDTTAPASHETRADVVKDDRQRRVRERSPSSLEDMEQRRGEKPRQQRDSTHDSRDEMDNLERSMSMDVDGRTRVWDRSGRDTRYNRRSRSPERIGRNYRELEEHDRGFSDSDTERSISSNKVKEREKDGYREDKSSKGKDNIWNEKTGEREGSKDQWRRNQTRPDSKDVDDFDHMKEWDTKRRDQGRLGSENVHSRPGYRKDMRLRPEGVRGSSFGNRNENSDSIEIRPNKNLDFGREDPVAAFPGRKPDGSQQEFLSGANDGEWEYLHQEKGRPTYGYGDSFQDKHLDDSSSLDQTSGRNFLDSQAVKGRLQKNEMDTAHTSAANNNSQSSYGNYQGSGPLNRSQQGPKGGRPVRGGRGRLTGRDSQRVGLPPPIIGPPFGLGLSPGQLQPIGPNMNHSPLPPIGPGGFIPPFSGPLAWPGARGVDMNMLGAPPNLPLIPPPGPAGPRFPPNMGPGPGHPMHFNQPGPVRGLPPGILSPGSNAVGPIGRETPADKVSGGWVPPRMGGPSGKAPSRGEQNDYSQNFVDTGMRPQNFIRELELTSTVEDYPKLRELIQRKDEIVEKSATPPMYYKCDLREFVLTPEFFGTKFDVILVDPPWEEYVHRAPGITDHLEYWTVEEIMNLKIEAIADTPSFIFLWVGDGVGLEQGRQCLKKWGFRRCEDICWVKTNKRNAAPGLRHDSHTLFQHSKEHCLMGIKGTVRRSTDGHIIHANIDTDIIIAEEPGDAGSTKKPEDMYRIIEHFALGRRRLELFGEDHNIRSGWLTVGSGLSSSNFNSEAYIRSFADKDGKVWQGGGGRNPPPDASHLVMTTPEIENLRPKSPPAKNQQQQSTSMPIITGSNNRRASGNSPQNPMAGSLSGINIDTIGSEPATPAHWASSPMVGFRGPDGGVSGPDVFEGYGYNSPFVQGMGDYTDFDSHRPANLL